MPYRGLPRTGPPVFLVHAVDGSAFSLLPLVHSLEAGAPVYGFHAAGLLEGEAPQTDLDAMARRYLELLREAQPAGPYYLGGWSLGGVVATEMARRLRAGGEEVALVAVFDSVPRGHRAELLEGTDLLPLLAAFARVAGLDAERLRVTAAQVEGLGEEELLSYLAARAREDGVLPGDLEVGRLRRLLEVFRANCRLLAAWQPEPYPGRVTLFEASDEPVPASSAWEGLAGELLVHRVPGDHLSLMRPPQVAVLAEKLAAVLAGLPDRL